MEPSEANVFVDHKEIVISAPRPHQVSASKVDIIPPEETAELKIADREAAMTLAESVTNTSQSEKVTASVDPISFPVTKESAVTVTKHATTIYTRRIIGRTSSSSSSSHVIIPSPDGTEVDSNKPIFGTRLPEEPQSPSQVCSVQFTVAAGVTSNTTSAFSKMFSKTVDTTTEVSTKERHLSECSISVGEALDRPHSQETTLDQDKGESPTAAEERDSQGTDTLNMVDDDHVFTEAVNVVKAEEKEVSEYCPGLAIRTLTLEDLQEKRASPEREPGSSDSSMLNSTDMSTRSLTSSSSLTTYKQTEVVSALSNHSCPTMSLQADAKQDNIMSSEYNTSQLSSVPSSTTLLNSASSSILTSGGQVLMQCTEDQQLAAPTRKPFFNPIEVERKFTIAENTEERLKSLGARLHKEKTFTDVYYDNDDYALITRDCWLRRRNNCWEAKVPLKSQKSNALFSPASQYTEITNEREISNWLVDQLGLETWMRGDPIDLLAQAVGLIEFAKFTTTRRSYTLPSCIVDLDMTDHGFRVGEIEVMAASPEEVPQALQTISGVAKQLGVKECDKALGKVSQYLQRFNPPLLHRLVSSAPTSSVT